MPHRLLGYLTLVIGAVFLSLSLVYTYYTRIRPWKEVTAMADDIGNLKVDNPVQVAGVMVGKVEKIGRENGRARVDLRLRRDVALKNDYRILNVDVGLMGDRALVLFPGDTGAPRGDTALWITFLPGIAEGMSHADSLKAQIHQLKDLFAHAARIDPADASLFITKFQRIVRAVDGVTLALEKAVVPREKALNGQVDKLQSLAHQTRAIYRETAPEAKKAIEWSDKTSKEVVKLLDRTEPMVADLEKLSAALTKTDGWVMSLADGGEHYRKLYETLDKLKKVLTALQKHGMGIDIDLF